MPNRIVGPRGRNHRLHEHDVMVLVEGIRRDQPLGELDGTFGVPGQVRQRGLTQHRRGLGPEPPALARQPQVEPRHGVERHPFEQVTTQGGAGRGLGPPSPRHDVDIHDGSGSETQLDRVAAGDVAAEQATHAREHPPHRSEWILHVRKEQLGEALAGWWAVDHVQVGQCAPRLAIAGSARLAVGVANQRRTQELHRHAHRFTPDDVPPAVRPPACNLGCQRPGVCRVSSSM